MSNKRKEESSKNLPKKEVQRSCKQRGLHFQEGAGGFFQQAIYSNAIHNSHGGEVEVIHRGQQTDMGCNAHGKNATSVNSSSESPALFEFYVSSEDGIELSVDLTSSSSDWINRYNSQDLLSETLGTSKAKTCCQEFEQMGESGRNLRSSFFHNMGVGESKGVDLQAERSPSSVAGKCYHASNNGDVGSRYMLTTERLPSYADAYVSRVVEKDRKHISSRTTSHLQNQVSNIELYTKDELDSNIVDGILERRASNFAITSTSNHTRDTIAMEHQRSKSDGKVHKKSSLQKGCDLEDTNVIFSGYQASSSMGMQISDAGNFQNGASRLSHKNVKLSAMNNVRTNHDKLINSTEGEVFCSQIVTCFPEQL